MEKRRSRKELKKKRRQKINDSFWRTFSDLRNDPHILCLKEYPNHKISNLYDHSSRVAVCAYHLARRLRLNVDGKSLARGAMLHDYYLYHARANKELGARRHWFGHPHTAVKNAEKLFPLSDKEKNIIVSHMWPLTLLHYPKSKEAFLVSAADKVCAFGEMVLKRNGQHRSVRDAVRKYAK